MFNVHRLYCWLWTTLHFHLSFPLRFLCSKIRSVFSVQGSSVHAPETNLPATYFILKICANRYCSKYAVFNGHWPSVICHGVNKIVEILMCINRVNHLHSFISISLVQLYCCQLEIGIHICKRFAHLKFST